MREDFKYRFLTFFHDLFRPFVIVKDGIVNFWIWKRIIWRDRWWDHSFLEDIILFKLQTMIDRWDGSHYYGSDFTKKRMIVIKKRIQEFDEKMDDLTYDYIVNKLYTEEQYKELQKEIIKKTWGEFGRNLKRFWD